MKKILVAGAALAALTAAPAYAGGLHLGFGFSEPAPVYYAPAPAYYAPPPVAYYPPPPVYYTPPVYIYGYGYGYCPRPYYGNNFQVSYWDGGRGRWR